jgi:hypothetical protein
MYSLKINYTHDLFILSIIEIKSSTITSTCTRYCDEIILILLVSVPISRSIEQTEQHGTKDIDFNGSYYIYKISVIYHLHSRL